jgi:HAD superfamily hydrolase (TIGR01450 family)
VNPDGPLADRYDLFIFDLDGVVYLGREPIPGAVESIGALVAGGGRLAYATNNASRRAAEVAELLRGLGVPAREDEVVTSAQAAARLLADRLAPGAPVLVVGGDALRAEVTEVGLRPTGSAADDPAAVVQGYAPEVGWAQLAEAAVAVRGGARWVATNADRTLPSPRGPLPGNGSLVAALATALDRQPDDVVGKPAPGLFHSAAARAGATRPLVVGDRLDTDIEGAVRAGMDSLLVLTGVTSPAQLVGAAPRARPTMISADLRGLVELGTAVTVPVAGADATGVRIGGWAAGRTGDGVELSGDGPAVAALAALAALAWADGRVPRISAGGDRAAAALRDLDLAG